MIKAILVDAGGVLFLRDKNGMGYVNQTLINFIKDNRDSFKFGVISTTSYDLEEILEKNGTRDLFDIVITSGKTGLDKNEVEIYGLK